LNESKDTIVKFAQRISKIQDGIAAVALLLISGIILLSVFFRYVLFYSIPWSEELTKFCMMWMVYLGTGSVSWHGEHLQADLFGPSLKPALKKARDVFFEFLMMGLLVYISIETFAFAGRIRPINELSTVLRIPQWFTNVIFAVGILVMAIMHFCRVWVLLKGSKKVQIEGQAEAL
jgi:TRAP-type C4-dicarboxylate transport system permease small subunit